MFPIFKYAKSILKVVLYIVIYYLALIGGIFIIGFANIGTNPIEDVYRIGVSIVSTQPPWLLMLNLLVLIVLFNFFVKEKIKHNDLYSFTGIGIFNTVGLMVGGLVLNIIVSFLVVRFVPEYSNITVNTIKSLGEVYPFILFVNLGFIAPIVEELLFRFLVYHSLEEFGTVVATIISSTLFGLMHGNLVQMIYALCFGIIFCMINKSHKSMTPSIIMHCTINCFTTYYAIVTGGL